MVSPSPRGAVLKTAGWRQFALIAMGTRQDHETPLAMAQSELGARMVENLLYAVEHGLPL